MPRTTSRPAPRPRPGVVCGGALLFAAALALPACRLLPPSEDASPHARYRAALDGAGLLATEAGRAWASAADSAVARALPVALPHHEVAFADPAVPAALAWRVALPRGRVLAVAVAAESAPFVDLFRLRPGDPGPAFVAAADSSGALRHEAGADETLVVRVQPRLLEGGRVEVRLTTGPAVGFPVAGFDAGAVGSRFGVDRDGGARRHEGVDIFAPRGTPVVAVTDGVVSRVGTNTLGGNVVWLRDPDRGVSYYYAHLDTQRVGAGARVRAGDTLGTVGNTGNARTTPPHLHFGLYDLGAVDPFPFLDDRPARAPVPPADAPLGVWRRLTRTVGRLPEGAAVRVAGAFAGARRVVAPDGQTFEVPAAALAAGPLRTARTASPALLRARPAADAPALDSLPAGTAVAVVGEAGAYRRVEANGRAGWLGPDAPLR